MFDIEKIHKEANIPAQEKPRTEVSDFMSIVKTKSLESLQEENRQRFNNQKLNK